MNTLTHPTTNRTAVRPTPAPRPELPRDRNEPRAGMWGYRLAQTLVMSLLVSVCPVALAIGLGWLRWEEAQALIPALRKIAVTVWASSLIGMVLGVVGLSQFGRKVRTVLGLFVHLALALGPFLVAIFAR